MSFSNAETGVKVFHSRFNKGYRYQADCNYGELVPFCMRFVLPGDVWRIGADALIRYQPMLSPPLSRANARFRWFFVPLRQVEPNCEKVITGSDNGALISGALPKFKLIGEDQTGTTTVNLSDRALLSYMTLPVYEDPANNVKINYNSTNIRGKKGMMATYWPKGYFKIWNDFYRDENLQSEFSLNDTTYTGNSVFSIGLAQVNLKKDYFTSSLPFQLKGVAPSFQISINNPFTDSARLRLGPPTDFTGNPGTFVDASKNAQSGIWWLHLEQEPASQTLGTLGIHKDDLNASFNGAIGSFDGADLRTMMSQTRLFERLARCGSRYVEYLRANFQTAPADETLQRPKYLGGFKQPIVTTEIVQTAEDGTNPVGTLRGKGISAGGNTIGVHRFNEFGMLYGLIDIEPETLYTQGIDREFTYNERFDFFNPSFQHLSEQEIRNSEIYLTSADSLNERTFGFTEYANELRYSQNKVVGNLRGSLSYWTQPINFSSRPNLNSAFINTSSYKSTSWAQPFVVQQNSNPPIILDIQNMLDVYRPMVRHSTPGGL